MSYPSNCKACNGGGFFRVQKPGEFIFNFGFNDTKKDRLLSVCCPTCGSAGPTGMLIEPPSPGEISPHRHRDIRRRRQASELAKDKAE